jgi:hypothetical protein
MATQYVSYEASLNRQERRKIEAVERKSRRLLRLRCTGCDRVGLKMTKEHFFPKWLIDYAKVHHEGIAWLDDQRIDPDKATIPLCRDCNEGFGNSLETPVSAIFRELDRGAPISENEAELLVRWLWKFEGLQWAVTNNSSEGLYTHRYTLRERVATSRAFDEVRADMLLAIALIHSNDPEFKDWPMGLDTPSGESALTMSGVFGRVALICSLSRFADEIPDVYGKFRFGAPVADRAKKVFLPPMSFMFGRGATQTTMEVGHRLAEVHDAWGRDELRRQKGRTIIPVRRRVELPFIGKAPPNS